jgi:DNA polymerase-3 subunit chi
MTEVAFHFNVPDKLNYICRLLRKATQAKARVVVAGPADALQTLDEALWTFSAQSFITHCWSSDALPQAQLSQVVLQNSDSPTQETALPHHEILLNVGNHMPQGYETFERVIEVVGLSDEDKSHARERWKNYAKRGYSMVKHDLTPKGAAA